MRVKSLQLRESEQAQAFRHIRDASLRLVLCLDPEQTYHQLNSFQPGRVSGTAQRGSEDAVVKIILRV
jgi:hypothetical protein